MKVRKITLKHEKAKKTKRNQIIVGGILIFVMFFSVVGYGFLGRDMSSNESNASSGIVNYNGFEFVKNNNLWFLNIGDIIFRFKYNPNEIQHLVASESELKLLNSYSGKPLYIYSESGDAGFEISVNLNQIVLRMQKACHEDFKSLSVECDENLPLKTCENNFIIIRENPEISIMQEDNCVFISGPIENLTQITDEFLFKIIGVA